MAISLDAIVEEASRLPEEVVAELIERILVRRHGGVEAKVELAWRTEARRRIAEITEGRVEGVPAEEALARAARALRR